MARGIERPGTAAVGSAEKINGSPKRCRHPRKNNSIYCPDAAIGARARSCILFSFCFHFVFIFVFISFSFCFHFAFIASRSFEISSITRLEITCAQFPARTTLKIHARQQGGACSHANRTLVIHIARRIELIPLIRMKLLRYISRE